MMDMPHSDFYSTLFYSIRICMHDSHSVYRKVFSLTWVPLCVYIVNYVCTLSYLFLIQQHKNYLKVQ